MQFMPRRAAAPWSAPTLEPKHFAGWIDWARRQGLTLDFNPTFFAHPLAASGLTLSHADDSIRRYWVEHGRVCRKIGAAMGQAQNSACITNVWIPDGSKDLPVDRRGPRERLRQSLDEIFADKLDPRHNLDAVESKLFGIGSESYVVGSHEFYLGYAIQRKVLLCLDSGHFHPTESVADKISAVLTWLDEILLHVSRGVRWDSDHVVILSDELRALMQEVVRGDYLGRTHIALDFFDASINRVAAWVIGTRATLIALLHALLGAGRAAAAIGSGGRLHRAAGDVRRAEKHAVRSRLGLPLRNQRRSRRQSLARRRAALRARRTEQAVISEQATAAAASVTGPKQAGVADRPIRGIERSVVDVHQIDIVKDSPADAAAIQIANPVRGHVGDFHTQFVAFGAERADRHAIRRIDQRDDFLPVENYPRTVPHVAQVQEITVRFLRRPVKFDSVGGGAGKSFRCSAGRMSSTKRDHAGSQRSGRAGPPAMNSMFQSPSIGTASEAGDT